MGQGDMHGGVKSSFGMCFRGWNTYVQTKPSVRDFFCKEKLRKYIFRSQETPDRPFHHVGSSKSFGRRF